VPWSDRQRGTSVGTIVIVTVAILLSWMVIHLVGLKLAAVINNASVVTEIAGSLPVGVGLLIYALIHKVQDFSFLTTGPSANQAPTIGLLAAASLMAACTLTGFEGAADVAEDRTSRAAQSLRRWSSQSSFPPYSASSCCWASSWQHLTRRLYSPAPFRCWISQAITSVR
jgi:amino acid transporter